MSDGVSEGTPPACAGSRVRSPLDFVSIAGSLLTSTHRANLRSNLKSYSNNNKSIALKMNRAA